MSRIRARRKLEYFAARRDEVLVADKSRDMAIHQGKVLRQLGFLPLCRLSQSPFTHEWYQHWERFKGRWAATRKGLKPIVRQL